MERMTKMTTTTEYTGIERRKKGPLEKPLIFHVLDVGTRHMSKEDSDVLQRYVRNNEHPVYELAEYGWLIYATPVDGCWPGKELWLMPWGAITYVSTGMGKSTLSLKGSTGDS
jgi:hypothetical protein